MTHSLKVTSEEFKEIKDGSRTQYCLLGDEKNIVFLDGAEDDDDLQIIDAEHEENKILVGITHIGSTSSFEDVLSMYSTSELGGKNKKTLLAEFRKNHSVEDEKKYHVYTIGLSIKRNPADRIERAELIKALSDARKKFGIDDPDKLFDQSGPEIQKAKKLYDAYESQIEEDIKNSKTKRTEYQAKFDRDTVYLDAGLDKGDFLDDLINDYMVQDTPSPEDAPGEDIQDIIKKFMDVRGEFEALWNDKEV
jgi:hypothetical protein